MNIDLDHFTLRRIARSGRVLVSLCAVLLFLMRRRNVSVGGIVTHTNWIVLLLPAPCAVPRPCFAVHACCPAHAVHGCRCSCGRLRSIVVRAVQAILQSVRRRACPAMLRCVRV